MPLTEQRLNTSAETYCNRHSDNAYQKIGEDISMAVGNHQWDNAYFLQRVQWRVRKLERLREIAAELRLRDFTRAKGRGGDGAAVQPRTDIISLGG
jgi:hypothetical protein